MIRTIIIDDEALARARLRRLLAEFSDIEIVAEAEDGADAVLKIEEHRPDLLLLDVQMPELDGFGVLKMLDLQTMPKVIFITAHDQYAVDAFEVNAVDYLLKPVRLERLQQAINKARGKGAEATEQLANLLETITGKPRAFLQRLPARAGKRILIVNIEQITSFRIEQGLVY